MSQPLVYLLLSLVLILPVVGAVALRVLQPKLDTRAYYAVAVAIFGLAAASAIALATANITTLRVAGLTVLQPDSGQAEIPDAIDVPLDIPADATLTPEVTASATPTVTRVPTVTRAPTRTPTPAPTATPTMTPTATPETPTATPAPVGPRRYTIEAGDTLRDIAERFGVSVQAILDANRLTPAQADSLRPGQEIIIP